MEGWWICCQCRCTHRPQISCCPLCEHWRCQYCLVHPARPSRRAVCTSFCDSNQFGMGKRRQAMPANGHQLRVCSWRRDSTVAEMAGVTALRLHEEARREIFEVRRQQPPPSLLARESSRRERQAPTSSQRRPNPTTEGIDTARAPPPFQTQVDQDKKAMTEASRVMGDSMQQDDSRHSRVTRIHRTRAHPPTVFSTCHARRAIQNTQAHELCGASDSCAIFSGRKKYGSPNSSSTEANQSMLGRSGIRPDPRHKWAWWKICANARRQSDIGDWCEERGFAWRDAIARQVTSKVYACSRHGDQLDHRGMEDKERR